MKIFTIDDFCSANYLSAIALRSYMLSSNYLTMPVVVVSCAYASPTVHHEAYAHRPVVSLCIRFIYRHSQSVCDDSCDSCDSLGTYASLTVHHEAYA